MKINSARVYLFVQKKEKKKDIEDNNNNPYYIPLPILKVYCCIKTNIVENKQKIT